MCGVGVWPQVKAKNGSTQRAEGVRYFLGECFFFANKNWNKKVVQPFTIYNSAQMRSLIILEHVNDI